MIDDSRFPILIRSALFVPADKPRALEKALNLTPDAILVDLEDAVAPARKAQARLNAEAAIPRLKAAGQRAVLRISEPDAPALALDIPVAVRTQPDAVLIAKLETPDQLTESRRRLDQAGFEGPVWAMIETPRAIQNVDEISREAHQNRLKALIGGANDLAATLRLPESPHRRAALEPHLARLVLAARASGLAALDTVFNAYKDESGLVEEAQRGRRMGFDGKTLIHPAQILPTHAVFTPTAKEIDWATEVCAAFENPANAGKGAVPLEGRMVEHVHWRAARAILAAAAAI